MPLRVLVVDDSNFFQQRLKEIINRHPDLQVVGIAGNGREAVDKTLSLKPDIITMDFEMPVMDGVTAVRLIMAQCPTPILMFSSLTYEGARVTLDALAAGALDFMPKNFGEVSQRAQSLSDKLHERLLTLGKSGRTPIPKVSPQPERPAVPVQPRPISAPKARSSRARPELVIIGASTGGPVALTDVLVRLPRVFAAPILLVQHMPENFTKAFADRLDKQCQIRVREAVDGDRLEPGLALLAPGGKQMLVERHGDGATVKIMQDDRVTYKPSLDITFGSAAKQFGAGVLGVVLTGMGSDGREGARMLKAVGSEIWAQDEASSVIYGMPMAVAQAGLTDRILSLTDMGPSIAREVL
ncbi:chemotaxis response regulator protein-glutamate methylesterase [Marinimicrobium sp. ABcell2]|uniref:protein-glutamate methylesterase/protein-glutamine glutaminase n=1 Tax=Marinimicrobium sp. ABcell2 TaxID=3069751 RepID=UPI0027B1FC73|nr:chemotaxis response regulator protein-glutamate methylesterase [Marinimicrobium sp. ABcell2]MDQ2078073.1 chemotaxis response regulator protein-glutamate methylesterase [Marinimicrobium sp. ABcell2]